MKLFFTCPSLESHFLWTPGHRHRRSGSLLQLTGLADWHNYHNLERVWGQWLDKRDKFSQASADFKDALARALSWFSSCGGHCYMFHSFTSSERYLAKYTKNLQFVRREVTVGGMRGLEIRLGLPMLPALISGLLISSSSSVKWGHMISLLIGFYEYCIWQACKALSILTNMKCSEWWLLFIIINYINHVKYSILCWMPHTWHQRKY